MRSRLRPLVTLVLAATACGAAAAPVHAQVELDRIVSRAAGRPIMQSDVRQARRLGLVADTSSDAATLRALENRWLMLDEIARAAPGLPVADDAIDARLAEWRGVRGRGAPLLPMGDPDLRGWFRDDLRIEAYLDRRFGMVPGPERARVRNEWIGRLRQRAELD